MAQRRILVTALLVSGAMLAACSGRPAQHVPPIGVQEPHGPQGAGAQSPTPQAPSTGAGIPAPEPPANRRVKAPGRTEFGVVAPGKIWYKDDQGAQREIEVPYSVAGDH